MSNNNRRSKGPVPRGGLRRSNTPPPPSVKLGIDGLPEEGPISTSRLRDEAPKEVPVLEPPPADIKAAVAPPAPPEPAPAAVDTLVDPPPASDRETLPSQPDPSAALATLADNPPTLPSEPPMGRKSAAPGRRKGNSARRSSSPRPDDVPTAAPPLVADTEAPTKEPPVAARAEPPKRVEPTRPEAKPEEEDEHRPAAHDLDHKFFDSESPQSHDPDLDTSHDEKWEQKMRPEVRARRQKNTTIVMAAVGVGLVLGVIGLVRSFASAHTTPPEPTAGQAVQPAPVVAPPPPAVSAASSGWAAASGSAAAPAPSDIPEIPAASAAPGASGSAAVAAGEVPPTKGEDLTAKEDTVKAPPGASPAPGAPVTAAAPSEGDKKGAAQEKRALQTLLDQGAFGKAIEAGERSVALDPTDGDAWLMLGAAYQSVGKAAEARRSFASCVSEGKRGQISECRSMLHQ